MGVIPPDSFMVVTVFFGPLSFGPCGKLELGRVILLILLTNINFIAFSHVYIYFFVCWWGQGLGLRGF